MAKFSLTRSKAGTAAVTPGRKSAGITKQARALARQREQQAALLARFRARTAQEPKEEA